MLIGGAAHAEGVGRLADMVAMVAQAYAGSDGQHALHTTNIPPTLVAEGGRRASVSPREAEVPGGLSG